MPAHPPKLLVATGNSHKTAEIRQILGPEWNVQDLNDHPHLPHPEETGVTFADNAIIKAVTASRELEGLVLADDSGLEVDALGGEPGVRSARYAGEPSNDAANCELLLQKLGEAGVKGKGRAARFRCAMALAEGGAVLGVFEGAVEGVIINVRKGEGGFGYDPLFVPEGYCQTFSELSADVKNRESHRARALKKVCQWLTQQR